MPQPHDIKVTRVASIITAVVRDRVPARELSRFVPASCGDVWNHFRTAGLPKPGRNVAVYLGGTTEAGAEVSAPFTGTTRIHCSQTPAGLAATMTHFGPYQKLGDAQRALERWCADNGYEVTDTSWELYGHWQEAWNRDPSQIRTEVFRLLKERAAK